MFVVRTGATGHIEHRMQGRIDAGQTIAKQVRLALVVLRGIEGVVVLGAQLEHRHTRVERYGGGINEKRPGRTRAQLAAVGRVRNRARLDARRVDSSSSRCARSPS